MIDDLIHPEVRTFFLILLAACLYALRRGRLPERAAALALMLAWIATQATNSHDALRPEYAMFAVDILLLIMLGALALMTDRRWLMVATACHLLTVGDHIAMMLDVRILSYAYRTVMVIWGYAVILAMVLGTWLEAERHERKRPGLGPPGPHAPATSDASPITRPNRKEGYERAIRRG